MNKSKLDQLLQQARATPPPVSSPGFEADVLRAIRAEPDRSARPSGSLFDELGRWFPRLAWAAAGLIVLCVAADFALVAAGVSDLDDDVAQVSEQLIFNANEF
jgi:hypothetical protein